MNWSNPFSRIVDVIDEAVEDKDLRNTLKSKLDLLEAETVKKSAEYANNEYLAELNNKTIPWVDAIHKMGRQIQGYLGIALATYMVKKGYDPMAAMAAISPGALYSVFKNTKFNLGKKHIP